LVEARAAEAEAEDGRRAACTIAEGGTMRVLATLRLLFIYVVEAYAVWSLQRRIRRRPPMEGDDFVPFIDVEVDSEASSIVK
jgi:hypothetical protein